MSEIKKDSEESTKAKTGVAALFENIAAAPQVGDTIEGPVVDIDRGRIYINIAPFGTAIIYGREYLSARDILKNVNIGDTIEAKVVDAENNEGYIEVSLREARQALIWGEAEDALSNKTPMELLVKDANKGGLIIDWQGVHGFLPASQLGIDNYPRVPDGDKDKIFSGLKGLIGQKLTVTIITADPKEGKLIFSEKGISSEAAKTEGAKEYSVGDEVDGTVTGATDFGVFVKIGDQLEGLVHISEMDWALVEDPKSRYRIGETVKVRIIDMKEGKISLSIKALISDPWQSASEKYKKGDKVEAVVIKYNNHGALASVEEGVAGLVHVSEFGGFDEIREELELGKVYPFKISLFDPKDRKMTLTFKEKAPKKSKEEKAE